MGSMCIQVNVPAGTSLIKSDGTALSPTSDFVANFHNMAGQVVDSLTYNWVCYNNKGMLGEIIGTDDEIFVTTDQLNALCVSDSSALSLIAKADNSDSYPANFFVAACIFIQDAAGICDNSGVCGSVVQAANNIIDDTATAVNVVSYLYKFALIAIAAFGLWWVYGKFVKNRKR